VDVLHLRHPTPAASVATSLLRAEMHQIGADLNTSLRTGLPSVAASIRSVRNPLLTGYRCADSEWIWLLCLEGDRHWPNVAAALELPRPTRLPALRHDGRPRDHTTEVSPTLQSRFDRYSSDEWSTRLRARTRRRDRQAQAIEPDRRRESPSLRDIPASEVRDRVQSRTLEVHNVTVQ
jgi:crotonobetainyl-CoA:carnitine CoA-transferase CaiB-like acyl-CoA transferase